MYNKTKQSQTLLNASDYNLFIKQLNNMKKKYCLSQQLHMYVQLYQVTYRDLMEAFQY